MSSKLELMPVLHLTVPVIMVKHLSEEACSLMIGYDMYV